MDVTKVVVALYIGLSYFIADVLAQDLDLQNVFKGGFGVETAFKDDAYFTEITPSREATIERVFNATQLVWEPMDDEYTKAVTLVSFDSNRDTLMFIEIQAPDFTYTRYYETAGSLYLEISEDWYNYRLQILKRMPEREPATSSREEGDPNLLGRTEVIDLAVQTPIERFQDDSDSEGQLVIDFPDIDSTPDEEEEEEDNVSTVNLAILDISNPKGNEWITWEYEINDGVGCLIIQVDDGKNIRAVHDRFNVIWTGTYQTTLNAVTAYSFYGETRLAEVSYSYKDQEFLKYYRKSTLEYHEVVAPEFERAYQEMKARIPHDGDICLDLYQIDADKYFQKVDERDNFSVITCYPLPGYFVKEVRHDDKVLWKTSTKRCVAATIVREDDVVLLAKLEIVNTRNFTKVRCFRREGSNFFQICESEFEMCLDNPNLESDDFVFRRFEVDNMTDDSFDPPEEDVVNPRSGMRPLVILDICDNYGSIVEESQFKGVFYRTYTPAGIEMIKGLKFGNAYIWEAVNEQYTDFIRVFFPDATPRLGFIRVVDGDSEVDRYFSFENGFWAFVSQERFLQLFDRYAPK